MQQRAQDQPRALAVRAPARQQRLRVSDQRDRVRLLEEVQYRRLRRHRRVPSLLAVECADSRTRHLLVQATEARSIRQPSPRECVEIRRAAKTYRAGVQAHSRLRLFHPRYRQSAASRWKAPGSRHKRLSGASRRHRSMPTTERRRYRLQCLPRPRELRQVVILLPVVRWEQTVHLTRPVRAVLVWCRM